jgi:thiol-disulfide isomerase/thioredoxin
MNALALGPLVLPAALLVGLLALVAGYIAGAIAQRRRHGQFDDGYTNIVLASLIGARLGFVAMYAPVYAASPWSVLDISDAGFSVPGAIAGALAMLAWIALRRKAMNRSLGAALVVAAVTLVAGGLLVRTPPPPAVLATSGLVALDGRPLSLQAYAGKPVVLSLWATWCPHCRRQMPALAAAQRARPDIVFLFVSQGETGAVVQQYVAAMAQPVANVLLDPQARLGKVAGSRAVPATIFIDRAGAVASIRIGALSAATLAQRLEQLD